LPETHETLISAIHGTPAQVVLVVTGGGTAAISELLTVPGASATVLEAVVPYSQRSLESFLGGASDSACGEPTARALAMAAWMRARELVDDEETTTLIGIACTASLASNRPKRGPHRAHLALQTADETRSLSITFTKGARSRAEEERLTADFVLNLLAQASGVDQRLPLDLRGGEKVVEKSAVAGEDLRELIAGSLDAIFMGDGIDDGERHTRGLIFPGAFNPLHEGHQRMAKLATERTGLPVEFELAIVNVDKPPLDYIEIDRRVGQFGDDPPLWLTRTATFIEKSRLFPGATFVVGADTIVRIANPLYYGGETACDAAIAELADRECRFLVFGRLMSDEFRPLSNIELPADLLDLCDEVAETDFRSDISSTELRKREG
jgi:nicotinamide mononucleotide (NMN) deamidase PncC